MDVDAECTDDDLFEDEADAIDEDDLGQSRKEGDEDPADDDDDDGDENPTTMSKPKARTKVTNVGHKGKLSPRRLHPVLHPKGGICVQNNDAQFPRVST